MKDISRNLTMLFDFYELTMGNGYFENGMQDKIVYFDVFYRNNPDNGGFAIAAGLQQVVEYVKALHFDEDDIAFLRSKGCFSEKFLEFLKDFRFTGDIWAIPEGTVVFFFFSLSSNEYCDTGSCLSSLSGVYNEE